MQEFQWHVRWPVSHPMIPPPLLWFAMNDMYTENFTEWQLNSLSKELVGGYKMSPSDALKIAKGADFGMSFDPKEQIPHGGMIFPGAFSMPNYNPDHGPTVSEDEAKPPIPAHLLPITERWLDPYYGTTIDVANPSDDATKEEIKREMEEEEERRLAAEALMTSFAAKAYSNSRETDYKSKPNSPSVVIPFSAASSQEEILNLMKEIPSMSFASADAPKMIGELARFRSPIPPVDIEKLRKMTPAEIDALSVEALQSDEEEMDVIREIVKQERNKKIAEIEVQLDLASKGVARSRKRLISYTIETIRDMQAEIIRAESDLATRKR